MLFYMECDVCKKEAQHYEDKQKEQWFCEDCGWWINVWSYNWGKTMKEEYKDDSILDTPEMCPDCGFDIIDCTCEDMKRWKKRK